VSEKKRTCRTATRYWFRTPNKSLVYCYLL